jgi:hypothetical protein
MKPRFNTPEIAVFGLLIGASGVRVNSQFPATCGLPGGFVRSSGGSVCARGNPGFRAFSGFFG